MTQDMDAGARLLDFWRAVEYFNLNPVPAPKAQSQIRDIRSDRDWPWLDKRYARTIDRKQREVVFFHVVYLGLVDIRSALTEIYQVFEGELEDLGGRLPNARAAMAALVVDDDGRLVDPQGALLTPLGEDNEDDTSPRFPLKEVQIASFPWAMGQLSAIHQSGVRQLGSFEQTLQSIREGLESIFCADHAEPGSYLRIDAETVQRALDYLCTRFQWHSRTPVILARCKSFQRTLVKGRPLSRIDSPLLNSFVVEDIARATSAWRKRESSPALQRYLDALSPAKQQLRQDFGADPAVAASALDPKRLAPGGWPANGGFPLVFAQQAAVNLIDHTLADGAGLFAVNGPPGTGKTTMLRDVIASVLVRRARVLAELKGAHQAFGDWQKLTGEQTVAPLNPALLGFEMVVASANNGAVENITKELPARKEVDPRWLDNTLLPLERVLHLADVADLLLLPLEKQQDISDDEEGAALADEGETSIPAEESPEPAWALLGAALGNSRNRKQFVKRFWRWQRDQKAPAGEFFNAVMDDAQSCTDPKRIFAESQRGFKAADQAFQAEQQRMINIAADYERLRVLAKQKSQLSAALQSAIQHCGGLSQKVKDANAQIVALTRRQRDMRALKEWGAAITARHAAENALLSASAEHDLRKEFFSNSSLAIKRAEIEQESVVSARDQIQICRDRHDKTAPKWWESLLLKWIVPSIARRIRDWKQALTLLNNEEADAKEAVSAGASRLAKSNVEKMAIAETVERASRAVATARFKVEAARTAENEAKSVLVGDIDGWVPRITTVLDLPGEIERLSASVQGMLDAATQSLAKERAQIQSLQQALHAAEVERCKLVDTSSKIDKAIADLSASLPKFSGHYTALGQDYWQDMGDDAHERRLQLLAPWMDDALRDARIRLFLAALQLHRDFMAAAWKSGLGQNLSLFMKLLQDRISDDAEPYLPSLWGSLFLAVPVVSSTFASFGRLFSGLGKASIGWVFIDEAGQAAPQLAVGALWRARRAVVIGDPLQIDPVVTLPAKLIARLREHFQIEPGYSPEGTSVQRLADQSSRYGRTLTNGMWVGCPLRVHRRCDDPMFSVSNKVAYDGLMVHGRARKTDFPALFGPSQWVHVPQRANRNHFVPDEGVLAIQLAAVLRQDHPGLRVYLISPFRDVKDGLITMAKEMPVFGDAWADKHIGTIHTFQGKEADVVFFVLGSDPKSAGARSWAAEKPNILNVAVTRAKERCYVIGNCDLWANQSFFEQMARSFPRATVNDMKRFIAHAVHKTQAIDL